MRVCLLVLSLIVVTERAADASCACLPKLSPESGAVPLRGSLYLGDVYLLDHGDVSLRWIGAPGTATWAVRGGVARLDYSGPDGSELVVMLYQRYEQARYKLESDWRAPATAPRAIRFEHEESRWTCASTDALFIDLDQSTAAVRVRWTRAGKTQTRVLATDGQVALGHVGCCGTTLSPEELHAGGALELVAIRVDGSEARILDVPSFVSSLMYGSPTQDASSAPGVGDSDEPAASHPHPDDSSMPAWLEAILSLGLMAPLIYLSRKISA